MRYFFVIFFAFLAFCTYPRKIRTRPIPNHHEIVAPMCDTINKKDYSLIIEYEDSMPKVWEMHGPSRIVRFDGVDPRLMPVYFNPASPKFFHAYPDCKKIGAFRKLSETPIQDFLRSNKTANICPDCMQRHKTFFIVTQFILDDPE